MLARAQLLRIHRACVRTCLSECGMVLEATTASRRDLLILSSALPEKMPCVTMASTRAAPFSSSTSAAMPRVPQVSAMSSTRMAVLPATLPTRTMRETSLAFLRSLWMSAKSTSSLSAIDVALVEDGHRTRTVRHGQWLSKGRYEADVVACHAYRLAPPASGETMTTLLVSGTFMRMYLSMLGSAYRLSTGMSKNPYDGDHASHAERHAVNKGCAAILRRRPCART